MAQQIKKVGILGAGLMGHGITQVTAQSGYEVVVREVDEATLQKGLGKIEKQLARAVEKGKATQEDADGVRARIHGTVDYGELSDCDLVIEAITEDLELKLAMWKEVDALAKDGAVRAYEAGVGSAPEIDEAMKAGAAHPMGPLTLADFVGLDTMGAVSDVMFEEFRERRFARPPLLRKMLAAGWYGRKSGIGFY